MTDATNTTAVLPRAAGAEDTGEVIGYMCRIDWECELGMAMGGNRIYPSLADLRRNHPCADECGIVEVEVRVRKVVVEGIDL